MNSEGHIREFETVKKAVEIGYHHQLTHDELKYVEKFLEAERGVRLKEYRIKRQAMFYKKQGVTKSIAGKGRSDHTVKLFQRPNKNKNKKKMIKRSKKLNRK